jgi:hypothetical protein
MFYIIPISVFHKQKYLLLFLYFITFGAHSQNLTGIVLEKKLMGRPKLSLGQLFVGKMLITEHPPIQKVNLR